MSFIGHFLLPFAFIVYLLFWAVILVLAVWLVMWAIRRFPGRDRGNTALSILNERFARGEIDQAEYDSRKAVLTKTS
ncbi:MAG: hypothetical protein E6I88_11880 [Chloroflexi bacterium]|nr:MAG: hypothetical protein E6I88_11880 [Chloroflexota bacterium]